MPAAIHALLFIAPFSALAPGEPAPSSASFCFAHEITPLLARQGCSSAYCHGSATGRGGFKLSLFGTDPEADFRAIVEDLGGRRVDLLDPDSSLVLLKPSRTLKHGGGKVLPTDSEAYAAVRRWIESGAAYEVGPRLEPRALRLERDGERFRAIASFGPTSAAQAQSGAASAPARAALDRDVSRLVVFSSSDDTVAAVDRDGRVELRGPGEAWVLARFGQLHARAAVVQRFRGPAAVAAGGRGSPEDATPTASAAPPAMHPLDALWIERLAALGLEPAPAAPPHVLARRLYLDLAGRPPTVLELRDFLALDELDRVQRTAEKLVRAAGFARVFGRHLADGFEVPPPGRDERQDASRNARLRASLADAVAASVPLDRLARSFFASRREGDAGAAADLLARFGDPRDRAEFAGRAFLGIRIGCARCHNHPLDRWTRSDHLAFSAFFADPRPAPEGGVRSGLLFHPESGEVIEPRLLPSDDGQTNAAASPCEARDASPGDTRSLDGGDALAGFVAGHPLFAQSFANRVFAALLGRGLVEPLDDHRLSNPAVHEPVLDHLAAFLRGSGFDLRALVLHIVTSRLYSLSSSSVSGVAASEGPGGPHDGVVDLERRFFARRESRSLPPWLFIESVHQVLGVPLPAEGTYPDLLPEPPLSRQLALLNGPLLHRALAAPGNEVEAVFDFAGGAEEQLEALFLLVLSRPPRSEEQAALLPLLLGKSARGEVLAAGKDLALSLFLSREFGSLR